MILTFLGTSCMVPTKERNVPAVFLKFRSEGILFDCGEGTQRQMNIAGIKRTDVTKIFVSHWHGDHVSGIIGLLQTLGNNDLPPKLEIFGPKGTMEHMEHLMQACVFEARVNLKVHELVPKGIESCLDAEEYAVECVPLQHSTPCLGYRFSEKDRYRILTSKLRRLGVPDGAHLQPLQKGKDITFKGKKILASEVTQKVQGKVISYVMDTAYCNNAVEISKEADVLITESSYAAVLEEKAGHYKHLTAKQAATIASRAGAKKLILMHFSQRYKDVSEIRQDAKELFNDVICAEDFMRVEV
ncbi:MAG TPA: ribonuclease Z [Candidatus Nanoarchaeia archaeon]|nr:ribonuclease Z [Candidatus Nanoarchaeia archaeon]